MWIYGQWKGKVIFLIICVGMQPEKWWSQSIMPVAGWHNPVEHSLIFPKSWMATLGTYFGKVLCVIKCVRTLNTISYLPKFEFEKTCLLDLNVGALLLLHAGMCIRTTDRARGEQGHQLATTDDVLVSINTEISRSLISACIQSLFIFLYLWIELDESSDDSGSADSSSSPWFQDRSPLSLGSGLESSLDSGLEGLTSKTISSICVPKQTITGPAWTATIEKIMWQSETN